LRWGFPIAEKEFLNIGIAVDSTNTIIDRTYSPPQYIRFVDENGGRNGTSVKNFTLPITIGWVKDTRDSHIYPTTGMVLRAGGELSPPGTDLPYYRANVGLQYFHPISNDLTLAVSADVAVGKGLSGKTLPFYKNFYAGGIGSVRGYETSSLGPTVTYIDGTGQQVTDRLGGTRKVNGTLELLFGLPGFDRSLRMGVFTDIGQIFGPGDRTNVCNWCASAGVSLAWISPLGPLKFNLAQPLNRQSGDKIEPLSVHDGYNFLIAGAVS